MYRQIVYCSEQQIKAAHRKLSRRKQGSHRRNRAKRNLQRLYRNTRHRRQDFLHKTSRHLVDTYATLVFEELQITNMVARSKPKQDEETGKYLTNGAVTKSGLNKSILDAAWGTFMRLCASKAEEVGCTVAKVLPHYSSQLCHACGALVPKDLSVRWHSCPDCGADLDRDENSAKIHLERYRQHRDATGQGPRVLRKKPKLKEPLDGAGRVPQEPAPRAEGRAPCRSPRL
ncbi:MAG TPA: transposase [Ktedonobacteraceae bacterium]